MAIQQTGRSRARRRTRSATAEVWGLAEAVTRAEAIRFTPAQKNGRPLFQWVVVEYNFNIY